MRHVSVAVALGLSAVACGEPDVAPVGFALEVTSRALLENLAVVQVQLHPGEVDCDALFVTGPGYQAVYELEVTIGENAEAGSGTLYGVVEDEYTVDAWGLGPAGFPRGYACLEAPISVQRGRQTSIELVMMPLGGT